jgi:hypothetical protein
VLDVNVFDPDAVASGIREVLQGWRPDPAAVSWAKRYFSWDRAARQTVEVYKECL